MPIPRELGGEGRPKVDYYLLTTNAQRLADVAISLTIQVNTSIGTTPVLLARDKDLPKAQKDLGPFVGDPAFKGKSRAASAVDRAADRRRGSRARPARPSAELHKRLEETVLSRRRLCGHLPSDSCEAWQEAGRGRASISTWPA